jgi:hypothetical protein
MLKLKSALPLALFCLYFIKTLIRPSGYEDAVILTVLGSIAAFYEFKSSEVKIINLEKQMTKLNEDLELRNKEIDSIKSAVASMKLAQGMRGLGAAGGR